jgi:hypothetical protein
MVMDEKKRIELVEDLLLYFLSPFCVEKENLIVDRSDSANY